MWAITFICYRVTENAMALEDDTLVLPRDLPLTADLFSRDAIISKDDQASRLALAYPDGQEYVVMQFDEPIFGLWSPKSDAPFVCLEPWILMHLYLRSGHRKEKTHRLSALNRGMEDVMQMILQVRFRSAHMKEC